MSKQIPKSSRYSYAELLKRTVYLCAGLFLMAFGVAFSIKANLGTSPISSVPYVVSLFSTLTVGNLTILLHCILIAMQILILRNDYRPTQLLQLLIAVIFGYLTDFAIWVLQEITYTAYWQQWLLCMTGIIVLATGVSIEVNAKLVPLAGEGFSLAMCQKLPIKFSTMKILCDVGLVLTACILSFLFLGRLEGVREGTIAAAVLVGVIVRYINKPMTRFEKRYLN